MACWAYASYGSTRTACWSDWNAPQTARSGRYTTVAKRPGAASGTRMAVSAWPRIASPWASVTYVSQVNNYGWMSCALVQARPSAGGALAPYRDPRRACLGVPGHPWREGLRGAGGRSPVHAAQIPSHEELSEFLIADLLYGNGDCCAYGSRSAIEQVENVLFAQILKKMTLLALHQENGHETFKSPPMFVRSRL